jgi:hypothetical protein
MPAVRAVLAQPVQQTQYVRVALARLFSRRLPDDFVHGRRRVGAKLYHRRHGQFQVLLEIGHRRWAAEGFLAAQEFKQHQSQRVDVGLRPQWLGLDLLGRQVGRLAR